LDKSSSKQRAVLALTFSGAGLEQTTGTAALEAFTALGELHLGVWDTDIAPARTPAARTATT